jgi:hypothetical protein
LVNGEENVLVNIAKVATPEVCDLNKILVVFFFDVALDSFERSVGNIGIPGVIVAGGTFMRIVQQHFAWSLALATGTGIIAITFAVTEPIGGYRTRVTTERRAGARSAARLGVQLPAELRQMIPI